MQLSISLLVILLPLLQCSSAVLTPVMQAVILKKHNDLRAKVVGRPPAANMEKMAWNQALAVIAQEHAENCVWESNDMRHAEAEHLFPSGVGESMSVTYGYSAVVNQSPEQFVQEWYDESRYFNYTLNTCQTGRMCSDYTQLVWATTTAVGCGFHICREFEFYGQMLPLAAFFVCNYGPQGNRPGFRPYVRGLPCSYCPQGKQHCENNLCTLGARVYKLPPTNAPTTIAATTTAPTTAIPATVAKATTAPTTITTAPAMLHPTVQTRMTKTVPVETTFSRTTSPLPALASIPTEHQEMRAATATSNVQSTVAPITGPIQESTLPSNSSGTSTSTLTGNLTSVCANPTSQAERETCWQKSWENWRKIFETWVHNFCPN